MSGADLLAILALAVACLGFGGLQLWLVRRDPGNPGLRRSCEGGHSGGRSPSESGCGSCPEDFDGGCRSCQDPPRG